MGDDPEEFREAVFDSDSFSEWLESTAQSTGKSQEAILQQLIASYWTMNEIAMDESTPPIEESQSEDDEPSGEDRTDDPDASQVGEVRARVEELHGWIEELNERVEVLEEGSGDDEEAIEELRRRVETQRGRINELQGRYESIEELDEIVAQSLRLYESLSESQESIRTGHGELREDHDALRRRIDEEFANLRAIVEYLIETTEGNEAAVEELTATQEEMSAERERLIELKETAIHRGVEKAACGYCGTDIDLGLLEAPTCPQCARTFDSLEREPKWFGLAASNRLTTTEEPLTAREGTTAPDRTKTRGGGSADAEGADEDGFRWVGSRSQRGPGRSRSG